MTLSAVLDRVGIVKKSKSWNKAQVHVHSSTVNIINYDASRILVKC